MKRSIWIILACILIMASLSACAKEYDTHDRLSPSTSIPTEQIATSTPIIDKSEATHYSREIYISNDIGVDITELYISISGDENWSDNILGDASFEYGGSQTFQLDFESSADFTWDILVIDEEGHEIVFHAIDISSAVEMVLYRGDRYEEPTVIITRPNT